jgi:uncharacterized lipoprotein YbaY
VHVVTGKVILDGWQGEPGSATVYVRLLDTSLMDVAARRIAETIVHDIEVDHLQLEGMHFCIPVEEVDARARYEVSVLVDLDGDGQKGVGDYISVSAYPVLTHGHPDSVDILVRRIGGHADREAPRG